MARGVKGKDRRLVLVRKAATAASNKYGIGGRLKSVRGIAPITLPKLPCLAKSGGD